MNHSSPESPIVESRFLTASVVVLVMLGVLIIRLWYVQIYKGEYYRRISENNRIRRIEIPAPRGHIYDRNGKVVLGNRPFFDLVYIPQYVKDSAATLKTLARLLNISVTSLQRTLHSSQGRPEFLPITLKRNLSVHQVAIVQANKVFLPGIEINIAPRRDYGDDVPSHMVGYMGEISRADLDRLNQGVAKNPYLSGDLIGKQGLESRWEAFLRGKRGYRLIQVDAFGRQQLQQEIGDWSLPAQPASPGADLVLTLDHELQKASKKAFRGKYGAVVVLDPRNGQILSMLSAPDYDPAMYQGSLSVDKWRSLVNDPFKPLLDKTTGGEFSPGSLYKPLVALAALQEGIVTPSTTFYCGGSFELGSDTFHCHRRWGHGQVNLATALVQSCDVYFYNIGIELGMNRLASYAKAFGLGQRLGVRLNMERPGLVPEGLSGVAPYIGDMPPLSIGQGANLMTPIQIAVLYAALANGGKVWRPYLVHKMVNHVGETIYKQEAELLNEVKKIDQKWLRLMARILAEVVERPKGTGRRARLADHRVAGKTASVQVVGLKKNRNRGEAVSMKWREHALFAAFSPVEKPEVVVIVVSENDRVGGGGRAAAPVAKDILEAYWRLKKMRNEKIAVRL